MSTVNTLFFDDICQRGIIHDSDVLALRGRFFSDEPIAVHLAQHLFKLNRVCPSQADSWPPFFVEAITDYLVNDAEPEGYLTQSNADWLIHQLTWNGAINTQTEIALLLNVLDKARWSPATLVAFTLQQVQRAVCEGHGPLRAESAPDAGVVVTEDDVELLRRILYAFAGDENVAITRQEAEILFDINDAAADADNCPHWQDLFVKAIASSIMQASGYSVPSRSEMLRREAWLDSRGDLSLGNIISQALRGGFSSIREAYANWFDGKDDTTTAGNDADTATKSGDDVLAGYQQQSPEARAIARLEQHRLEIITNAEVTMADAAWLAARIGRDDRLTSNEIALLQCLKKRAPKLPSELAGLLEKAADAA
ncbi:MAG: hypothetical protein ACR2PA_00580 [Hyphomicrobiaceae bacterium]